MEELNDKNLYYIVFNEEVVETDLSDQDTAYYTSKEKAIDAIKEFAEYNMAEIYYNDGETIKAIDPETDETYVFKVCSKEVDEVINVSHRDWVNVALY